MHDEHDHHHGSHLSETELRVRALETILIEKGYVDPKALDVLIETYETTVGPHNGARVVAKAWSDAFKARLLKDATGAIAELGFTGRQGEHMVAVETPTRCTTLSFVRSALAILGPSWVCRRFGTSPHPIAHARS